MEHETERFVYSDGGRAEAGFKGLVGDCVARAICNATGKDYLEVYNRINELSNDERITKTKTERSNARTGVYKDTAKKLLEEYGFKWVALMGIGTGCKVHLKKEELPKGVIVCRLSRHYVCCKDGVIYDTFDCSREGTRCVYGYFTQMKGGLNKK